MSQRPSQPWPIEQRTANAEPVNMRITRTLRNQIMRGERAPGEIITIRRLAEELDVSPMPVRDALRQLVAERAVEVVNGNRSVAVPPLDIARLHDLRNIRENLEGLAARLAAELWLPHQLARIEAILEDSETSGDEPDLGKNMEFHFAIYAASQSAVLLPLIESLWLQFGPYLGRVVEIAGDRLGTGDNHHREVVEALKRRDADRAQAAIVADISRAMALLIDQGGITHQPDNKGRFASRVT